MSHTPTNPRPLTEPEIERRLAQTPVPPPPSDLLDRLKADIPEDLGPAQASEGPPTRATSWWQDQRLRLAAGLLVVLGAGLLALRFTEERRATAPAVTDQTAASGTLSQPSTAVAAEANGATSEAAPAPTPPAPASLSGGGEADALAQVAATQRSRDALISYNRATTAPESAAPGASVSSLRNLPRVAPKSAAPRQATGAAGTEADTFETEIQSLARQDEARKVAVPAPASEAAPAAAAGRSQEASAAPGGQEVRGLGRQFEAHNKTIAQLQREQEKLEEERRRGPRAETPSRRAATAGEPAEPKPRAATLGGKEAAQSAAAAGSSFDDYMTKKRDELLKKQGDLNTEVERPGPESSALADRKDSADRGATALLPSPDQPTDMFFRDAGTNPFVDTASDPLSTFQLDVDTGSYTLGRSYLARELLPPPASIRLEEWVNAFDYEDPAPQGGDFALRLEAAPTPYDPSGRTVLMRIGVRARDVAAAERRPAALTFLIDTSGSMARGERLAMVQRALGMLLDQLRDDDSVALVTFGARGRVVLPPTWDKASIRQALEGLQAQGSTNLEEGMALAYELASRSFRRGAINRVVLCSDGVANVGLADPEALLGSVADWAARGIELNTVGVGMGNYNDALLERLADRGDGSYAYVDTLKEAYRLFVENLTGTLETIGSDARIQVELDPRAVTRYRLLGYENRDLPDEAFRNDSADGGELGAGHRVSALYELQLAEGVTAGPLASATLRYRSKRTGRFEEISTRLARRALASSFERAPRSLRLAATVAELAELLRHDGGQERLDRLFRRSQNLLPEFPGRSDVAELVSLIGSARDLAARRH